MLVGNDVVDLRDLENQPSAIHSRFDERVFTRAERARLTLEATAHRTRWRMWAAKESAFKVARKIDPAVRFLPRRFAVRFEGNARAVVQHAVGRFDVSFSGADDWVHAIATLSDGVAARVPAAMVPAAMIERVHRGRSAAAHASARVRTMARSAVGSLLSIAPAEIEIAPAGRIPVATWRKLPLPVDLSLSHHGRFLACAWSRRGR
ncbi:MAG: 4'-phosphopantetheinyl transferase superfamily protein [Gemmatimonadota bacterium]